MREEEERLFARRSFIVAAVLMAALVAGGVWLLLGSRGSSPSAGQSATPASVGSSVAASADGDGSVCGLAAGDQGEPTGSLGVSTIEISGDLVVPDVAGAGPGITDGISRCFAHSPTGSVVAAYNAIKWISSNQRLDEVTQLLLADGSDKDRMAKEVEQTWDGSTTTPVSVWGYKTEIRSADEVVVTLAVTQTGVTNRPVAWPMVMVWEDGDWKVKPPSTSSWGQETIEGTVYSAGYEDWGV